MNLDEIRNLAKENNVDNYKRKGEKLLLKELEQKGIVIEKEEIVSKASPEISFNELILEKTKEIGLLQDKIKQLQKDIEDLNIKNYEKQTQPSIKDLMNARQKQEKEGKITIPITRRSIAKNI